METVSEGSLIDETSDEEASDVIRVVEEREPSPHPRAILCSFDEHRLVLKIKLDKPTKAAMRSKVEQMHRSGLFAPVFICTKNRSGDCVLSL